MEQSGGGDGFAKGKTAGSEDDDGPEKVVEVFFGEDTSAEEKDHWDECHNSHVSEDAFELVGDAPENDSADGDAADKPLDAGKLVLHRSDRDDSSAFAGLKRDEKEDPYENDGDDADWQGDKEPGAPTRFRLHILQGDYVLR